MIAGYISKLLALITVSKAKSSHSLGIRRYSRAFSGKEIKFIGLKIQLLRKLDFRPTKATIIVLVFGC